MNKIREEWNRLKKERRDYSNLVMQGFDVSLYQKLRELRARCEKETGHNFRFTHFGPVGHAWYHCIYCGASRVEKD